MARAFIFGANAAKLFGPARGENFRIRRRSDTGLGIKPSTRPQIPIAAHVDDVGFGHFHPKSGIGTVAAVRGNIPLGLFLMQKGKNNWFDNKAPAEGEPSAPFIVFETSSDLLSTIAAIEDPSVRVDFEKFIPVVQAAEAEVAKATEAARAALMKLAGAKDDEAPAVAAAVEATAEEPVIAPESADEGVAVDSGCEPVQVE